MPANPTHARTAQQHAVLLHHHNLRLVALRREKSTVHPGVFFKRRRHHGRPVDQKVCRYGRAIHCDSVQIPAASPCESSTGAAVNHAQP